MQIILKYSKRKRKQKLCESLFDLKKKKKNIKIILRSLLYLYLNQYRTYKVLLVDLAFY